MATKAVRWTDEKVKAIRPDEGQTEVRKLVSPGLYLFARRGAQGKISRQWQYRAQVNGKRRWLSLGAYPSIGLAQANEEMLSHQKAHQAALKGEADHPVLEAQKQREQFKGQPTVIEAFDLWIADKRLGSPKKGGLPVKERTVLILQQAFDQDVRSTIGHFKIAKITRESIQQCIDAPRKRGSPGQASQVFRMLRGLTRFSEGRGYIDGISPMRGIENPAPYKPKRPNAANDAQIVAFFKAFANSEVSPTTRQLAELWIYTGCRSGEGRKARWSQVNLTKREWVIPIEDDKLSRGFKIHLCSGALAVFEQAKALNPGSDLVFPAPMSTKEEKLVGFGVVGQAIKRIAAQTDDEDFLRMTAHDLRKTLKTMMSRIGIQPHVSELCLNHTEKNILRRIYDGYDYWPEMVSAWDRVGAHLDSLRSGGALVIPIATKLAA